MSQATIRAAIAAVISGVSGVENVHQYERYKRSWGDVLTLFKDANGKIQGWTISRAQTAQQQISAGEIEKAHVFRVRAVYGLEDSQASEQDFQNLVDTVQDAFNETANWNLGGVCLSIRPTWGPMAGAVGLMVDVVDVRMFDGVLCHVMEGRIGAEETASEG